MGMIWWTFYSAKVSVSTKNLPKFYAAIIILGFTALVGVFWEFYELIIDRLITKNNYISLLQQGGLLDTLKDLFVDILGERWRCGDFFMKEKNKKVKISFFGGTEEVTGSNYLVEIDGVRGKTRILVDCGLFQGSRVSEEKTANLFPTNRLPLTPCWLLTLTWTTWENSKIGQRRIQGQNLFHLSDQRFCQTYAD